MHVTSAARLAQLPWRQAKRFTKRKTMQFPCAAPRRTVEKSIIDWSISQKSCLEGGCIPSDNGWILRYTLNQSSSIHPSINQDVFLNLCNCYLVKAGYKYRRQEYENKKEWAVDRMKFQHVA